jgi:hypothetical protein
MTLGEAAAAVSVAVSLSAMSYLSRTRSGTHMHNKKPRGPERGRVARLLEELMHNNQPEASRPRGRNVAPANQISWFGCHSALRQ